MILPRSQDAIHRMYLLRLLMAILDDAQTNSRLAFKGGTAAVLAGWLTVFPDLDFDLIGKGQKALMIHLNTLYGQCGLAVKQQTRSGAYTVLSYEAPRAEKYAQSEHHDYKDFRQSIYSGVFGDINRYALCQTRDTMVANKPSLG